MRLVLIENNAGVRAILVYCSSIMIEADEEYMLSVKLLAWGYKRFGLSKLS